MNQSGSSTHPFEGLFTAQVEDTDRISARVKSKENNDPVSAEVEEISPLGIVLSALSTENFHAEDPVNLELVIGGQQSELHGIVVESTADGKLSIRFTVNRSSQDSENADRRNNYRWLCAPNFLPVAVAPSLVRYNDYMRFSIIDVSAGGMLLRSSLSNKFLIPNTVLDLTTSFPLVGNTTLLSKIVRVDIKSLSGKEYLELGVEFQSLSSEARETISRYLLQYSETASPESLAANGFPVVVDIKGIRFSDARSDEEYKDILELRNSPPSKFDLDARILMGKVNGVCICSARVRFPSQTAALFGEIENHWTEDLPPRTQLVEISDIHVHDECNTDEIIGALFRNIVVSSTTTRRPHVLVASTTDLDDFAEKLGLTKLSFNQSVYFFGNAVNSLTGRNVNPIAWNFVWRETAEFMINNHLLAPNGIERKILRIYNAINPILALFYSQKK